MFRALRRKLTAALGVALLATGLAVASGSALADTGTTQANVAVASSITLSSLTSSFTLSGSPGSTVQRTALSR
ncbi:MAG: hypothetical protein H0V45_04990 [Actinobacteria bacterium]|nr:hypothetical protein [Actinomycetota bacterium]